jgi:hypothetical protein
MTGGERLDHAAAALRGLRALESLEKQLAEDPGTPPLAARAREALAGARPLLRESPSGR